MKSVIAIALFAICSIIPGIHLGPIPNCGHRAYAQNIQRGIQNYLDVVNGRKKFDQLSPEEQKEVISVYRRVQSRSRSRGDSDECREARERAEQAASELADYARRLQRCAEGQDFADDCSTQFRRVRNAFSEYESAISNVGSYCN